ncbi:MAG: ral L-amino acid transport system permease protein [Aliidongia sp.]|nr:ral L-amino acid transport system permease protein [Aliidongia sp.]
MTLPSRSTVPSGLAPSLWNNPAVRSTVWQILTVAVLLGVMFFFVHNSLLNLQRQSIATGFGFLDKEAGFDIGESLVEYSPSSTFRRAFLVGLLNTLEVSALGIVLSTLFGIALGIARLSPNWLLSRLALIYVEVVRNIPLLLQLLFLYSLVNVVAPPPRQAWHPVPGFYLSNRGLFLPVPIAHESHIYIVIAFAVAITIAFGMARWARRRQDRTGAIFPVFPVAIGLVLGLPILAWLAAGAPAALSVPELTGFNFTGGASLSPELTALLGGLVIYTTAYIGEIVRSGILAVSHGQSEAAAALGLKRGLILRLVVMPQAIRIIVPPMTSQYLNLMKNSTLAVAIGFPEFFSVVNTQINQTGQAIEGMACIMGAYLSVSLTISLLMNIYNARIALKGR